MIKELVKTRQQVPNIFYGALLKENISFADILKINVAMQHLDE